MDPKTKYYRNKTEIEGYEPESLWELREDDYLYLVNDDEFARVKLEENKEQFYETTNPLNHAT